MGTMKKRQKKTANNKSNQSRKAKGNDKLKFIPTGKSKPKDPDGFLTWIQEIGSVRMEFEVFEESLYEAIVNVLPRMKVDFEKYNAPLSHVTYGRMIGYLITQFNNLGGFSEKKIDQEGRFTLKKLLDDYKHERDKFSHFRMGFSKAMHRDGPEGYEARVTYRNRVHKMHYHLCQIFEALFYVSSVTFYETGPVVKRVAKYDLEDMKKNYLPKVYEVFSLPHNRFQRRQIKAHFEKQKRRLSEKNKGQMKVRMR